MVYLELPQRTQRRGMKGWVCQMFLEVDSCQPILQKVLCLCGIAAETWLRIPRKRTGEDHTIIINIISIKNWTTFNAHFSKLIFIDGHLLSLLLFIKINSGTNKEKQINNVYIYTDFFTIYWLAISIIASYLKCTTSYNASIVIVYRCLLRVYFYYLWKSDTLLHPL